MIVNLTPHAINVIGLATYPPSGEVARVGETSTRVGEVDGIEIVTRQYGEVTGVPAQQAGVFYLVSAMVRLAMPSRTDLLSPGDLVRDEAGKPIGCRNLVVNEGGER